VHENEGFCPVSDKQSRALPRVHALRNPNNGYVGFVTIAFFHTHLRYNSTLFDMQLAFKTGRAEGTYREIPEVWLGLLMEIRGLHCSEQTTPNEIRQALIDSMKKPVDYTGWSVRELRRSIIARGIRRSCVDRNRARLVSILEKEDAQPDSTHCFPFERLVSHTE